MSRIRKAIVAFFVPLLGLPLGSWLSGEVPFDAGYVVTTVVTAVIAAYGVWRTPNSPA